MPTRYDLNIEDHNIVALAYNEDKTGIPVFFIHGITASVGFWEFSQTPIFNEQFRWYSLSLPGHYPATFPENFKREDLTAEMIARILTKAIRELAGEQAVYLVGHSTGGFAVLSIASQSPELVVGLISIAGFLQGKWSGGLGAMQMLVRLGGRLGDIAFIGWYKLNQKSKIINRPMWRIYAVQSRQMYLNIHSHFDSMHETFSHLDLEAMTDYFARMPDIDIRHKLAQIECPVLVLAGDHDPIVAPSQAKIIAESVQTGDLEYLPQVGHLPMFENPEAYHAIMTKWVQDKFVRTAEDAS